MVDVLKTLESKGVISHQEFEALKQKINQDAQKAVEQQQVAVQQAVQDAAPQLKTVALPQEEEGKAMNVVSAMDNGVGFHTGRFDVAFSGEVNGFFVHDRPDTSHAAAFAATGGCDLCLISSANNGDFRSNNAIRSGLLPSDLSIKISTQEHGWDVAVFFGIWPAIQNNRLPSVETAVGGQFAGGTPGIDFRQNFATLGRPGFGTLKIGRDLGLFGQEAILNDMTLLGAGSTNGSNVNPANVTFGRIGVGYVYTDFLPQVTYTTPTLHGLQAAIGVMQPYDDPFAGNTGVSLGAHTQPMVQGKVTFTAPLHGAVKAKFWGNFVTQKETADVTQLQPNATILAGGDGVRATGVDYGAKLDFHGLSLVAYGYNGWGLGTTALLFDGIGTDSNGNVDTRRSEGWYGQLTYTAHKNTFGFSYGQSNLSLAGGDVINLGAAAGGIVRNNTAYIGQYRLAVTKWDNLVAEYTHATAENQAFVKGNSDSIALGTIVFF